MIKEENCLPQSFFLQEVIDKSQFSFKRKQPFQYLVILDFEATCDNDKTKFTPQEIIEFPSCLFNTSTMEVEEEFHSFVRPVVHPYLTPFCQKLTRISQQEVDQAPLFSEVLKRYHQWIEKFLLNHNHSFTFVTWDKWDLGDMLPNQCKLSNVERPSYFDQWADIRVLYRSVFAKFRGGLHAALRNCELESSGRKHSGLGDSRTTAILTKYLMTESVLFDVNSKLCGETVEIKEFDSL